FQFAAFAEARTAGVRKCKRESLMGRKRAILPDFAMPAYAARGEPHQTRFSPRFSQRSSAHGRSFRTCFAAELLFSRAHSRSSATRFQSSCTIFWQVAVYALHRTENAPH